MVENMKNYPETNLMSETKSLLNLTCINAILK